MRLRSCASMVLLASLWAGRAWGLDLFTSENPDVRSGNEKLAAGDVAAALKRYDAAARALPGRPEVHLNRGLALLRLGGERLDEAMQAFRLAGESGGADEVRARALRNLGDAFFLEEDYKAAIDHYRKSLMIAPGNRDAAWNLEVARQRLKEQQEQEREREQQEQEQQDQDQQDQDQEQEQQDQDQEQEQQEQEQEQQEQEQEQEQREQEQEQREQPQPQEEPPRTSQEMEQVLEALDRDEENLFKEQARQRARRFPGQVAKDW